MRAGHEVWTTQSLTQAMETGEITVADYARLQPLASERELRFAEITHELNIGGLFALAYADEYPIAASEDEPAPVQPDPIFALIERHRAARAACVGLDDGKDKEGYEDAHDARFEALEAVESTQPTTIAGLLALARHMDRYRREDAGSDRYTDASADGFSLSALINACLTLSKPSAKVAAFEAGADPILEAIAASQRADDAMATFDAAPTGPAEETAIILAQNEARRMVWTTVTDHAQRPVPHSFGTSISRWGSPSARTGEPRWTRSFAAMPIMALLAAVEAETRDGT